MATVTWTSGGSIADRFPPGTSVAAYKRSNWQQWQLPPAGSPQGSSDASGTVAADGSLTLAGLAASTGYYLYASVGGEDRYSSMTSDAAPAAAATDVHLIGGSGEPAFTGGAANSDPANYHVAGFSKIGDHVFLFGVISSVGSSFVFTLPEGYRPAQHVLTGVFNEGGYTRFDVLADGRCQIFASAGYSGLGTVNFPVA